MASKQQLIKEVAQELGWTQADVKRAVDEYGDVSTKEEVYACLLHYAGPRMKELIYKLGAQKGVNTKQKQLVEELVNQLTSVTDFYCNQIVPVFKQQILEQAAYIKDILKKVGGASEEG